MAPLSERSISRASARTQSRAMSGRRTEVTRSANARTVDLVTTQNRRVVERIQTKDCISDACARKVQGRLLR